MGKDLNPKVTVLMPVYNGERYLREAIESILSQTFHDFEFLIINDASTDGSVEIINSYSDPRIRLVHNKTNMGRCATPNKGLDLAKGEYLARMDCDDVCPSTRLEKQLIFLNAHPNVGVCGTWIKLFMGTDLIIKYPLTHEEIKCHMILGSQLAGASAMFRKKVFLAHHLYYDVNYKLAEDYELWTRCAFATRLANIPEILYEYRWHTEQISQTDSLGLDKYASDVRMKYLSVLIDITDENKALINELFFLKKYIPCMDKLDKGNEFMFYLSSENTKKLIFSVNIFNAFLSERWFELCNASCTLGYSVWDHYLRSELRHGNNISLKREFVLLVKCLLRYNKATKYQISKIL
jgi:glycosyltransferase involved in cell wall biosynthesis